MANVRLLDHVQVVSEVDGSAKVHIPPCCFWDCVECFGENRMDASFTFLSPGFVARIRSASALRVHDVLHDWATDQQGRCA
jgi:hypothetical protein